MPSPGVSETIKALELSDQDLASAVVPEQASSILTRVAAFSEGTFLGDLEARGCWAICRHCDLYPAALRNAPAAPRALFGRGDLQHVRELGQLTTVTIVGARRSTVYGREVARELGRELAAAGLVVVSGLAFGVDGCAHRGALDAGATIAVLPCGPDIAYPASHRPLWRRIAQQGLVVSEFPPGTAPWRWSFPARNRIMGSLSAMTVVVEAAPSSGSLLTADFALEAGRQVGAVPGQVTSRASTGSNRLLTEGAQVIRDARDVLLGVSRDPEGNAPGLHFGLDRPPKQDEAS